jgi:hypothetical protein
MCCPQHDWRACAWQQSFGLAILKSLRLALQFWLGMAEEPGKNGYIGLA